MDEQDLDRLFATFLPSLLARSEDATRLVLNPITVDVDVVAFGVWLVKERWAGALVNGVDAHTSARLQRAREIWALHPADRSFHARAGAYALRFEEGDEICAAWGNARTSWTWASGTLHRNLE